MNSAQVKNFIQKILLKSTFPELFINNSSKFFNFLTKMSKLQRCSIILNLQICKRIGIISAHKKNIHLAQSSIF